MSKIKATSSLYKKQTCPELKEAALLVGSGIVYQENGNFEMAQSQIQKGIEKIKELLINDASIDREMLLNYYTLFEKFLSNSFTQQENEKNESQIVRSLLQIASQKPPSQPTLKEVFEEFKNKKIQSPAQLLEFTNEIMVFFARCFDEGFYFSQNVFFRLEIFAQFNAKIDYLHQKYETYNVLSSKIENLLILAKKNVIKFENIESFCFLINNIQNNFSNELKIVKPTDYKIKKDDNSTYGLFKKFAEISNKLKGNLLVPRLSSNKDYFKVLSKLCKQFKDFNQIFGAKSYEQEKLGLLEEKKKEVCSFFYHTIIIWTFQDIFELTTRFLKKKVMIFEKTEESL